MKSTHTPGPWEIYGCTLYAGTYPVARTWDSEYSGLPEPEREANARLIAAAPELLAIIRALLPHAQNEWTRLDDLAHRGHLESENSAMNLDRWIEHAFETIDKLEVK